MTSTHIISIQKGFVYFFMLMHLTEAPIARLYVLDKYVEPAAFKA